MDNRKNLIGLDILKIIAATIIVFHHYQQVFEVRFPAVNFWGSRFYCGLFVELFFVISGFLTLHSAKKESIIRAFARKLLRIYPMAAVSSAFTLIVRSIASDDAFLLHLLWNVKTLAANFLLFFAGWPFFSLVGINTPLWFLCVLIQCYMVHYAILWLCDNCRLKAEWIMISTIILIAFLNHFGYIPWVTYRGIEAFLIGELLEKHINEVPANGYILVAGGIVFFAVSLFVSDYYQRVLVTFLTFPLLTAAMARINVKAAVQIQNDISVCGKASFEVFLWHYPLMATEQMIQRLTGIEISRSYLTMIVFTAAVWILACMMYRFVEKPIQDTIRRRLFTVPG